MHSMSVHLHQHTRAHRHTDTGAQAHRRTGAQAYKCTGVQAHMNMHVGLCQGLWFDLFIQRETNASGDVCGSTFAVLHRNSDRSIVTAMKDLEYTPPPSPLSPPNIPCGRAATNTMAQHGHQAQQHTHTGCLQHVPRCCPQMSSP